MSSFLESTGPLIEQAWAWFVAVGTLVLLVAAWRVLGTLAARHKAVDPRANLKRLVALAVALALGVGGWLAISDFEAKSDEGMHTTFVKSLDLSVGEGVYVEATNVVANKPASIALQEANLVTLMAAAQNDPSTANLKARNDLWGALNQSRKDLETAHATVARLTPNHQLWGEVKPLLDAHRDEEARHLLEAAVAAGMTHTHKDSHLADVEMADGIEESYHHLAAYREQMQSQMRLWVYPNLTGIMLAPFVFAGGSTLRRAFVPSDTVGFKPYPGKAAGFFLLLGAGSILGVPFGAWVLRDFSKRSKEGQISL